MNISGPPASSVVNNPMMVSNPSSPPFPPNTGGEPVTATQVLNLLIGDEGFYFGKCLFYVDYYERNNTFLGNNSKNICELYLIIERGAKNKGWLPALNQKDSHHTSYYYNQLKREGEWFWPTLTSYKDVLDNSFYIHRDKLDRFSEIIADSLNHSKVSGMMKSFF
tara:strand:+ start:210 stop:704 length:495 start_codon:yes stop_codon:yes gene_type:complete